MILNAAAVMATDEPDVPPEYRGYFNHYVDMRSLPERLLNLIDLTDQEVGRSFTLVAGVWQYPYLSGRDQTLEPAAEDIRALVHYLREVEHFDEIVVLENEEVNEKNFKFFLQSYFPARLQRFPRSRFLFAYSGHGIQDGTRGYLLQSSADSYNDKANSINMQVLRVLYQEVVDRAFHSLALINACHSGGFFKRPFDPQRRRLSPRERGAHAITAGGKVDEVAWHDPDVGPGSIFFEKVFAGLSGLADTVPRQADGFLGDGIITANELDLYVTSEVQLETNGKQNPKGSDISDDTSNGSFFFLNRARPIRAGYMKEWVRDKARPMGEEGTAIRPKPAPPEPEKPDDIRPSPKAAAGDLWVAPESGMRFRYLSPGTFVMGSADLLWEHRVPFRVAFGWGRPRSRRVSGS